MKRDKFISTLFIAFLCSIPAWQTLFCIQVQISGFLLPFLPKCCSHVQNLNFLLHVKKECAVFTKITLLPSQVRLVVCFYLCISHKVSQFCSCSHSSLRQQLKIFTLMKSEHLPSRTSVLYLKEVPSVRPMGIALFLVIFIIQILP